MDSFEAPRYRLLIVGLAPGLHGANRTGRVFTGDSSGTMLFRCLHRAGLTNQATATALKDGLVLHRVRMTNAVKCLPPGNKPTSGELRNCNPFLRAELAALQHPHWIVTLGHLAHAATLMALGVAQRAAPFAHGAKHHVDRYTVLSSYHCSRLNVNTGRLTEAMLQAIIDTAASAIR